MIGGIYTELDDWHFEDWEAIVVRARTRGSVWGMRVELTVDDGAIPGRSMQAWFAEASPMFSDGSVQTYVFPVERPAGVEQDAPWTHLAFAFAVFEETSIDIVSLSVVPSGATYPERIGVTSEARDESLRRALYARTPARLSYRVAIPPDGRLDLGLGVVRSDIPLNFKVSVQPSGGDVQTLLDESYADSKHWAQHSIALSRFGGQTVTLSLEADAEREGTVALWASPTLSGERRTEMPNIIFYVIDGGGADYMSVYGYNRRTTPNMERLAEEGAVFEQAYSNSTWTQPSTVSFMTSLQHSVFGGLNRGQHSSPVLTSEQLRSLRSLGYIR